MTQHRKIGRPRSIPYLQLSSRTTIISRNSKTKVEACVDSGTMRTDAAKVENVNSDTLGAGCVRSEPAGTRDDPADSSIKAGCVKVENVVEVESATAAKPRAQSVKAETTKAECASPTVLETESANQETADLVKIQRSKTESVKTDASKYNVIKRDPRKVPIVFAKVIEIHDTDSEPEVENDNHDSCVPAPDAVLKHEPVPAHKQDPELETSVEDGNQCETAESNDPIGSHSPSRPTTSNTVPEHNRQPAHLHMSVQPQHHWQPKARPPGVSSTIPHMAFIYEDDESDEGVPSDVDELASDSEEQASSASSPDSAARIHAALVGGR